MPDLEDALAELPVRLTWGGAAVDVDARGNEVAAALARIALAAVQAASADLWPRLKICASDECEWAYFDRSKNRSRVVVRVRLRQPDQDPGLPGAAEAGLRTRRHAQAGLTRR